MTRTYTAQFSKAEKLHISKRPKYCGTPCKRVKGDDSDDDGHGKGGGVDHRDSLSGGGFANLSYLPEGNYLQLDKIIRGSVYQGQVVNSSGSFENKNALSN